jgi:hypothetical protein
MVKRSLSCWQCGLPIEDPAARFCPHCGSPMVSTLTWWERFRRRPAWLQALAILAVVAVLGAGVGLAATLGLPLLRGEAAPTAQALAPTQPAGATQPAVWASATPENAPPTEAATITPAAPPTAQPTATVASPTDTPEAPTPSPTEDLAAALLDAAYRFQDAKAASQRTGDTSQLDEDLTGDALERQVELVERWRDQGCYWEISLNAPLTVTILEMRGPDAALVEVAKVETRLLYCDDALESETRNDAYTTTYLMQRIDGRWYTAERE